MNHLAVYALYPEVVTIDGIKAYDCENNLIEIDISAVNSWIDPNIYKSKRVLEYPSIGDQLDALWKGGDAATEMLAKVQAIKAKYPKPE